jgi:hypothetical protein
MKNSWLFPDAPHTVVYTTRDIMEGSKLILRVTHDPDDGAWQFHSSTTVPVAEGRIIALEEIVYKDSSLEELADLPMGWRAVRDSVNSSWSRHPIMLTVIAVGQYTHRHRARQNDYSAEESMACFMVQVR